MANVVVAEQKKVWVIDKVNVNEVTVGDIEELQEKFGGNLCVTNKENESFLIYADDQETEFLFETFLNKYAPCLTSQLVPLIYL